MGFKDIYGEEVDDEVFLTQVYKNVLGREPDADGLAYWSKELDDGKLTTSNMIQAVVQGAKASTGSADDASLLNNRATVGVELADAGILPQENQTTFCKV